MDPDLILADEPTGNLDSASSRNIISIVQRLAHEQNYCVVVVTPDMSILDSKDGINQMQDGMVARIKKNGKAGTALRNYLTGISHTFQWNEKAYFPPPREHVYNDFYKNS
jgi:ABC-type lipoprotein export system ATPase subunit